MKYVVINRASDGVYTSTHSSLALARKKVKDMVGKRSFEFQIGGYYYSDCGNRLTIEERPHDWSSSTEDRIRRAYDARECGVATSAQLKLLENKGF